MRSTRKVCLVLGVLVCAAVQAAPAISTEVLGVRLGAARDEVIRMHPGGASADGFYTVRDICSRFERVEFGFTEAGTLYRVNRWYAPDFIAGVGGGDIVTGLERLSAALQETFGDPQPIHRSGRGSPSDPLVISIVWNHDPRCLLAFRITANEAAIDACLMLLSNEIGKEARRPPADFGCTGKDGRVLGVRLGDSLGDVLKRHPNGVLEDNRLIVANPTEKHERVSFSFAPDGRLCQVELVYAAEFLTKTGKGSPTEGIQELISHLAGVHGPCDRMTNGGAAYHCDWLARGRPCALKLTIVQQPQASAVLSIEAAAATVRQWF